MIISEILSDDNIKHGFFTRKGGVSDGLYESLNTRLASDDMPENVKENRDIAMKKIGARGKDLYTLYQVHSNKAIYIDKVPDERIEADALVTDKPGLAIGVVTADCGPILFVDNKKKIIGAAHAGWKGAISGIIDNTIRQMVEIGSDISDIKAALGPCIHQKSYEVGGDFLEKFTSENKTNAQFFIPSVKDGHFMFDLPGYIVKRLKQCGIGQVDLIEHDTCAQEDNFFSYRRSCLKKETGYGCNLSAIVIS